MAISVSIAIDSACDLPAAVIEENGVEVLPISVKSADNVFVDVRDPDLTTTFYDNDMAAKGFSAETRPYTVAEMTERIEQELILKADEVLVMTINSARSEIYKNIQEAVFISTPKFKSIREASGKSSPFKIHVFDTGTMFTGQAILVHEAVRMIKEENKRPHEIIKKLEAIKDRVFAYVLPRDLYHLKNNASKKGDKSVGWFSYQVGTMLNVKPVIQCYKGETSPVDKVMGYEKGLELLFSKAKDAVHRGLLIKVISMSYAGNLSEIKAMKPFIEFESFLKEQGLPCMLAVMSTTAAINVGPGAFSLAYAEY
ncbi:MAG: DegV family protein [Gammaproteobacteria bacterium]|nr:DegV family protein [Gammaproteobacteria bacterium]